MIKYRFNENSKKIKTWQDFIEKKLKAKKVSQDQLLKRADFVSLHVPLLPSTRHMISTKELGKGTGLGLSTAYGIVKQSGGYIWADSTPDKGTTFEVYLPTVDEPLSSEHESRFSSASREGTETILLVEDERSVRRHRADDRNRVRRHQSRADRRRDGGSQR